MEEQHRAEHHARQPCTSRVPAPRGSCILHLLCTQDELRFLQLYLGDIYYAALFYKLTWTRDPKISWHHLALCCKKGLGGKAGGAWHLCTPPWGQSGDLQSDFPTWHQHPAPRDRAAIMAHWDRPHPAENRHIPYNGIQETT